MKPGKFTNMTSEYKKDATRYLPNLWHSLVQVIIQSRLGERTYTISKSPAKGSTMFNVEIVQYEEITQYVRKFIGNRTISPDNSLSIEISMRSKEGHEMVLEIWTLSSEENWDSPSQKICQAVTNRMSVLLKSAICVSRGTPAYGLSFQQSSETFVLLYRLYTQKPEYDSLGDKHVISTVGKTNIQSAYLSITVAYRTDLTYPSNAKPTLNEHNPIMLKSDHFKADSSPRYIRRQCDRVTDYSEAAHASDDSQDAINLTFHSPVEFHAPYPRSHTSSDSSTRGLQMTPSENIFIPFASTTPSSVDDFFSTPEHIPFSNLLVSTANDNKTQTPPENKERKVCEPESEERGGTPKSTKGGDKPPMTSSDHSNRSFTSNATKDDYDYVVIDLKTPFVGNDPGSVELTTMYEEWRTAPNLQTFSFYESDPVQESLCLQDQIKNFEIFKDDHDDFEKSLHSNDDQNS